MDGVLFRDYLIKKIVAGEKDVTRRLFGKGRINQKPDDWGFDGSHLRTNGEELLYHFTNKQGLTWICKSHLHIGQVLFIREAWRVSWVYDNKSPNDLLNETIHCISFHDKDYTGGGRWRSPLHLPARFARYFIQVKDIRAERLQEITDGEAIREGISNEWLPTKYSNVDMLLDPRAEFADLWDRINPQYPFESNPYVFRYEFTYLPEYHYQEGK